MKIQKTFLFILIYLFTIFGNNPLLSQNDQKQFLLFNSNLSSVFQLQEWKQNRDSVLVNQQYYPLEKIGINKQKITSLYFDVKQSKAIKKKDKIKRKNLTFLINDTIQKVEFKLLSDTLIYLEIKNIESVKKLSIYHKKELIGIFQLIPFPEIKIVLNIVPLKDPKWSIDTLKNQLTNQFKKLNVSVKFKISKIEKTKIYSKKEKLDNPLTSHDRYTNQMIKIRDEYFEKYSNANKNEYYLFITPSFQDSLLKSYSIQKGMFNFTSSENSQLIYDEVFRELIRGISGLENEKLIGINYEDTLWYNHLETWNLLKNNYNRYLYYDNYEDVRTNSGIFAFYFWEEDSNGNIKVNNNSFLSSVIRPYKKNYPSYYLNVTNPFYKILFKFYKNPFNLLHLVLLILAIFLYIYLKIKKSTRFKNSKWLNNSLGILLFSGFIIFNIGGYFLINIGYKWFQVFNGKVEELQNQSTNKVINSVAFNINDFSFSESKSYSELFRKKGRVWTKIKAKNVVYFQATINDQKEIVNLRYLNSSDSLKINSRKKIKAGTHYIVLTIKNSKGGKKETKIYNHIGINLTNKIALKDPVNRVLLFANGYRPTSLGGDVNQMFDDLQKHGIEYPNSSNMIYPFDRFNYWNPWREIDERIVKRINATEVLYADGHFSVATSNHASLLNFSTLAGIYPKRCINPKKHICYKTTQNNGFSTSITSWFNSSDNTYDLLARKSNKKGFKLRYNQGKLAGRNLLLQLNELPNSSQNDTISIVAHSMGFAYSLGIIDVIRGKINFGGFYIIAPENASAGKVFSKEWKQIWQYGSKLDVSSPYAPCLQDGVAAQTKVKGLPNSNQIFFPEELYKKQGFFESHFIGNYTWILDIPKGNRGFIKQN